MFSIVRTGMRICKLQTGENKIFSSVFPESCWRLDISIFRWNVQGKVDVEILNSARIVASSS